MAKSRLLFESAISSCVCGRVSSLPSVLAPVPPTTYHPPPNTLSAEASARARGTLSEEGQPPRVRRRGGGRRERGKGSTHAPRHSRGITRCDQSWPAVPEAKDSRREGSRRASHFPPDLFRSREHTYLSVSFSPAPHRPPRFPGPPSLPRCDSPRDI